MGTFSDIKKAALELLGSFTGSNSLQDVEKQFYQGVVDGSITFGVDGTSLSAYVADGTIDLTTAAGGDFFIQADGFAFGGEGSTADVSVDWYDTSKFEISNDAGSTGPVLAVDQRGGSNELQLTHNTISTIFGQPLNLNPVSGQDLKITVGGAGEVNITGLTGYADKATAEAALDVGDLYYITSTGAVHISLA